MKLRLVDVESNTYTTTFGTCDFCLRTGTCSEDTFVFEVVEGEFAGERVEVEGFYWSYGNFSSVEVDNHILFAEWLADEELPEATPDEMRNYYWLDTLVCDYDRFRE